MDTTSTPIPPAPLPAAGGSPHRMPGSWAHALDTADTALLDGLVTDDVVVDLTRAAGGIASDAAAFSGREDAVRVVIEAARRLRTLHRVTDIAVTPSDEAYRVDAYALAGHRVAGDGPGPRPGRHVLTGSRWRFLLRRDVDRRGVDRLRVARFETDCVWFESASSAPFEGAER